MAITYSRKCRRLWYGERACRVNERTGDEKKKIRERKCRVNANCFWPPGRYSKGNNTAAGPFLPRSGNIPQVYGTIRRWSLKQSYRLLTSGRFSNSPRCILLVICPISCGEGGGDVFPFFFGIFSWESKGGVQFSQGTPNFVLFSRRRCFLRRFLYAFLSSTHTHPAFPSTNLSSIYSPRDVMRQKKIKSKVGKAKQKENVAPCFLKVFY